MKVVLAGAAALLGAAASAQPPQGIPKDIYEALIPEGAVVGPTYTCPDPAERQTKPECCRMTLDIDAAGSVTRADVKCTFAPLEPVMKQCEMSQKHELQIGDAGPEPYSMTVFQEHFPTVRSAKDIEAMLPIAEKACDSLR